MLRFYKVLATVIEWSKDRVFPPTRTDVDDLLAELGLKSYDAWLIARIQRASLVHDFYWLKLEAEDSYGVSTARGRMGFPPPEWDYEV